MSGEEVSASGRGHVVHSTGDVDTLSARHEGMIEHDGGQVREAVANFGGRIIVSSGAVVGRIGIYNHSDFVGSGSPAFVQVTHSSSLVLVGNPRTLHVDEESSAIVFGEPHALHVQNGSNAILVTDDYEYLPIDMLYEPEGTIDLVMPDATGKVLGVAGEMAVHAVLDALNELPNTQQYDIARMRYDELLVNCRLQTFTDEDD